MLTLFLFDKWYVWAIVLSISVLSSSSTLIVCMSMVMMFKVIDYLTKHFYEIKLNQKSAIIAILVMVFVTIGFFKIGGHIVVKNKFLELLTRLTERSDASTMAHMNYYTSLPVIYRHFSFLEKLFGWGIGRSGNVFTTYFGMYKSIGDWSIESDPMNFLYSLGIFGMFLFYLFLINVMIKGWKIDRKAVVFIAILLVCGFLYAVQYIWVVMMEVYFFALLSKKKMVFEPINSKNTFSALIKEIMNEK